MSQIDWVDREKTLEHQTEQACIEDIVIEVVIEALGVLRGEGGECPSQLGVGIGNWIVAILPIFLRVSLLSLNGQWNGQ